LGCLLVLGLVLGCSLGDFEENPEDSRSGPTLPPAVTILAPEDGAGTYGGDFTLSWEVEHLTLAPAKIGERAFEGEGHVHVYVDGALVEESADTTTLISGLRGGEHTLLVRLAENDHTELEVSDSVGVAVHVPTIEIRTPVDGAVLAASSTPVTFVIDDFTLSPDIGGADVFGEGHFRVLVDGVVRDWESDPLLAMAGGIPEGVHTVAVELVTNDGRPLDPPVLDEVRVEVPVGAPGLYWDRTLFAEPFTSGTVPIALTTTGLTLFDRSLGRPPAEGEGHLHLYLNGEWLDATAETSRVLQNMAPGDHLFEARLVSNDGFELPIADRMRVTLAADRRDVRITAPGADWGVAPDVEMTFEVENFVLDAASIGAANVPGVGHAQVWVDDVLTAQTGSTTVSLSALAPGVRSVRVSLAENDGTPLSPPVYSALSWRVE
jgi:hypothetical protein